MFKKKQVIGLAIGLCIASVAAMGVIAAAALLNLSDGSMSAISSVVSTGFAAVAIVASLGMAEMVPEGSAAASAGDTSRRWQATEPPFADGLVERVDVDPSTGRVSIAFGGLTIDLRFQPDCLSIVDRSTEEAVSGSSWTPADA